MRIEDDVMIKATGSESLTTFERELRVIGSIISTIRRTRLKVLARRCTPCHVYLVNLRHGSESFFERDDDALIVCDVVHAGRAAFAVLEPFLADLLDDKIWRAALDVLGFVERFDVGGERFEQGFQRGVVGMLSGLAALQVGLNLRAISVEGICHRKHPGELGW